MPSRTRHTPSQARPFRHATVTVVVAVLAACGSPPAGGGDPTPIDTIGPRLFAPPGGASANGVAVGSDGGVAVAYQAYGTVGSDGAVAVASAGLMVLEPDGAVRLAGALGDAADRSAEAVTEAIDPATGAHDGWWLIGETSGAYESFVMRVDRAGAEVCRATRSGQANGVARLPDGGVVVVGEDSAGAPFDTDGFVQRFSASCADVWERTFGGPGRDFARAVSARGSGFAVVGSVDEGSPWHVDGAPGIRPFVSVWDADGNLTWGSVLDVFESFGVAVGVAADPSSGDVFVTGYANGEFEPGANRGGTDGFVARVRPEAADPVVWGRNLGSAESDNGWAVATAPNGDVVVVGGTKGALPGFTNAGSEDAWVMRLSDAGTVRWTWQAGSSEYDAAYGVATTAGGQSVTVGVAADGFLGLAGLETEGDGSSAYHGFVVMHLADGTVAP